MRDPVGPLHPTALSMALCLALPCTALADEPVTLDRLQVTATRSPQASQAVPAAISVVEGDGLRTGTVGAALSEKLALVPGLLARQRYNYAQDEQVSIRGFGTRSSFGIRGLRLVLDGIPATMPDGQGQLSHFNLATAERVEVLRGPFSALYGNASGGVLQLFTADGRAPGTFGVEAVAASAGQRRLSLELDDAHEQFDYRAGLTHFRSDGHRDHSRARRDSFNAKVNIDIDAATRLTVLANALDAPDALDPQGLTRAEYERDPTQASPGALAFGTRKSTRQHQMGAIFTRDFDDAQLRVLGYGGRREIEQVLSVPVGTQRNPLSGGGIIELDAPYRGIDARWTQRTTLAGRPLEWTLGLNHDRQQQARRGFENFAGDQLGVRGALRQQQDDAVQAFDQYLQLLWEPAPAWSLMAGVRRSAVTFTSRDRYITAANPDDSGRVRHRAVTPVFGANVQLRPGLHAYAAAGEAFETPTFNELGYRNDGGSGLNFGLRPARTRSVEAGLKFGRDDGVQAELAVFRARTRNELAVATSAGGRTTFQNAGRAQRDGVELSVQLPLTEGLRLQLAATTLDARHVDGFLTCAGAPCTRPEVPVAAGTRIAGVPQVTAAAALQWGDERGWHARLDGQTIGAVPVNTIDRERADAYAVFGASGGYGFAASGYEGRVFAGVTNLADRQYSGSVIVNEGNRRYYEPAPGRQVLVGVELRWRD